MPELTSEQLSAWSTELKTDPQGLGYANKSHAEIEKILKTAVREAKNDIQLPSSDLFEHIDAAENLAITDAAKRAIISDIFAAGTFKPGSNGFQKTIDALFGANSTTAKNIAKLQKKQGRRHEELGLPLPSTSDIANALKL